MPARPAQRAPDPRGEDTRQRLILAGLELFAQHGLDSVTTRALCQKADVNQAAIPYHFGGKEGVYLAVAQYIVDQAQPRIQPLLANIQSCLPPEPDDGDSRTRLAELLADLLAGLVRAMLEEPVAHWSFALLSREQFQPGAAFDLLYREVLEPVHQLCGQLTARLLNLPPDSPAAIHSENALLGMVSSFFMHRASLSRRLRTGAVPDAAALELAVRRVVGALGQIRELT